MSKNALPVCAPFYRDEEPEITYVLSSTDGFGHASRAIAVTQALEPAQPITFVTRGGPWNDYLKSNLSNYEGAVKFVQPDYDEYTPNEDYVRQNQHLLDVIALSRIVINDFHIQIPGLRSLIEKSGVVVPLVGIYHSISGYMSGDAEIIAFQQDSQKAAQQLDYMFLTEPKPDHDQPYELDSGTLVIPTDPIVKRTTLDASVVKTQLGLEPYEEFIYVQGGGLVNGEELEQVESSLQELAVQGLKIVIALNGNRVENHAPNLTYITPRSDGHNLIAASSGIIAKAGMGTICEAIAYRKPVLLVDYPTAEARIKFEMMKHVLGTDLPFRLDMKQGIWRQVKAWLDNTDEISERFASVPCDGASKVAKALERLQF